MLNIRDVPEHVPAHIHEITIQMKEVKAKKALGQHFLTDLPTAKRIADTISGTELQSACTPEDARRYGTLPVLEIGPGMGVLTNFLVEAGRDVTAIEIDTESVDYLHRRNPDLRVVEGDFLKMDLNELESGEFALIGNYPYNISSQIFFKALDYKDKIPVIAGMLQKEVAERICSGPGSKVYGILSVLLQAWYDCEYLFTVEPGSSLRRPRSAAECSASFATAGPLSGSTKRNSRQW